MTNPETIKTIQRELNKLTLEIGNLPAELKSIFCVARDIAQLRERERQFLVVRAQLQPRDPLNGGADVASIAESRSAQCSDLARLEVFHAALDASTELAEARKILVPLLARHAVLIGQLQTAESEKIQAEHDAREAIAAATAEAIAEVEARFAPPEPDAPAEPTALIRGRQKLESALA